MTTSNNFVNLKMLEEVVQEEVENFLINMKWLTESLKSEDRPFTKKITPYEEYVRFWNLGSDGWAAVVRKYGIEETKKMVRRALKLQVRFGPLDTPGGIPENLVQAVGQEAVAAPPPIPAAPAPAGMAEMMGAFGAQGPVQ